MGVSGTLRRRRIRRFAITVCIVLAGIACAFLWMRLRDRSAWPAAHPAIRWEPVASPLPEGATNAWTILQALAPADTPYAPPSPELIGELRRFEAFGLQGTNTYPRLDDWTQANGPALDLWRAAAGTPQAWASPGEIESRIPALMRAVEIARISSYRTAQALREARWADAVGAWSDTLRVADHVTRGQGSLGLFVALNMTLGVCRDIQMATVEQPLPEAVLRELFGLLRGMEESALPLADALRADWTVARLALSALWTPQAATMGPEEAKRHPAPMALRIARWLGSSPDVSTAHLDVVCSHAVAMAGMAYSKEGLFAGLPAWCRRDGRAPWTRDPLGALATTLFLRNTSASMAYPPNRTAELRAARIAIAMELARRQDPRKAWPGTWDALPEQTGLDPQALVDPFAPDGGRFILSQPTAEAWAFHSVGPDQQDHGGTNDWNAAASPGAADLLFTSAERTRRATAWQGEARQGPPATSPSQGTP